MIQQTTSLRKIAALRKPVRIVRGGQGSGKTISILIILINHASAVPDREILIISAELTKMRLTVIKDFIKVMKAAGIYNESRFLAETLYKFPNGSFIKFIGLDKEDVGKGLRSHVAYFNEVNKCNRESYVQVASRADVVYADYNPDAAFYIDEDVIGKPDVDFIQLTFNDNELLPERERENILAYYRDGYNEDGTVKNSYWANKWQVYGLGNIGSLEGVIFNNWDIVETIPDKAEFIAYGMDFGFTNDPTTLTGVWRMDGELYLKELIYERKLTTPLLVAEMRRVGVTHQKIIADSADPKTIQELRDNGFNAIGADKGSDSIRSSIDCLQSHKIHITSDSKNGINEGRAYRWREGKSPNEPEDKNNHFWDGVRYVALNCIMKKVMWEMY